ncbi:MAG TPA: PhzF family phenazine biosynthesis protein [Pyrinomonadaceae bacterium]|nr:PhzF family phenazine biosynthesis protein [Pyrinomonadaceae bacterium]
MRTYQFFQLDVFTDRAFCGNPLAVFPEGSGLSDGEMQQIAREMNLSETVFVLPSDKALRRLRIFTPTKELPMAGHPVVGTWNLLAQLGIIENAPENGLIEIEHELGVGILPVEIEFSGGKPRMVTMTQSKFTPGEIAEGVKLRTMIAESLNLTGADLIENAPVQICSTGINILIVPVRSLEVLKRSRPNASKMDELPPEFNGEFYLFAQETLDGGDSIAHARMYAPEFGITEDPATGSAAGSLSGYLIHHGLLQADASSENLHRFTIEQGDFMERPSRIRVEVRGTKGNIEKVRVGGASVVVAKGEIFV